MTLILFLLLFAHPTAPIHRTPDMGAINAHPSVHAVGPQMGKMGRI